MPSVAPYDTRYAPNGMVCSVDHLASEAGVTMLRAGGSAADAAIAANAVLAVTCQHMCGMGGDLFALVHVPGSAPVCLNASGRAGSGASAAALRDEGLTEMPRTGDIRSVPVPGCVDGWVELHARFGRLPLADVLAPAASYASEGFPAPVHLAGARAASVASLPGAGDYATATHPGSVVRRPGIARALADVAAGGRAAFYEGAFGRGLLDLGGGLFTADDLARSQADWVDPLSVEVWGHRVWTVPPNSQGYLTLASAWIAAGLDLPASFDDPLWPHLLVEAVRQASFDRLDVLHDNADGAALIDPVRLGPRRAAVSPATAAGALGESYGSGDTIYLCAVDGDRMGVSLIQSNAAGFGSLLVEPATGVFLHNRGIGFSLAPGHPAELAPGRRPPHTLSPALVTDEAGSVLRMVVGTEGGDTQPQVVLQLLARTLLHGQSAGDAMAAPRFVLGPAEGSTGFDVWRARGRVRVEVERTAPAAWVEGLVQRGHEVEATTRVGLAHLISVEEGGRMLAGASEPRVLTGSASGY